MMSVEVLASPGLFYMILSGILMLVLFLVLLSLCEEGQADG